MPTFAKATANAKDVKRFSGFAEKTEHLEPQNRPGAGTVGLRGAAPASIQRRDLFAEAPDTAKALARDHQLDIFEEHGPTAAGAANDGVLVNSGWTLFGRNAGEAQGRSARASPLAIDKATMKALEVTLN